MTHSSKQQKPNDQTPMVDMDARPERRLIRPGGSHRHIVYHIRVGQKPSAVTRDRLPLDLALVLDRSGSMQGGKLETAKRSALAVLEKLDERDRVAVVVYDDVIDVVQPTAPATQQLKAAVRSALAQIQARSATALHEGWLTGCQQIADDAPAAADQRLSRCFLLTDGLANVGLMDPEQIAAAAAGIYEKAGIGTSTFGIGRDYSEELLGPMAVAGGGQFHNLPTMEDITSTFVGELGDLFDVAAPHARLEIETSPGVTLDMISHYHVSAPSSVNHFGVVLGDLLSGDERFVVVRFAFPSGAIDAEMGVRARLVWEEQGVAQSTPWVETLFQVAPHDVCSAEAYDPFAAHWMGLHHAERAKRSAAVARRPDQRDAARHDLHGVARRIRHYAGADGELHDAINNLEVMAEELKEAPMEVMAAKEQWYMSQRVTRGHKDHRSK
jgi:Ca-activated chloride channel homolog